MENNEDLEPDFEESQSEEAFHLEIDLDDTGEYTNVLVIPCNDSFIVVANNEHLCTMAISCDEPQCWELRDASFLEDEAVEKIGAAISAYINQF
jgi:hypothetical protein